MAEREDDQDFCPHGFPPDYPDCCYPMPEAPTVPSERDAVAREPICDLCQVQAHGPRRKATICAEHYGELLQEMERAEGQVRELTAEVADLREEQAEGIAENHAIYTLTDNPREGFTLQQEIRAQHEELTAEVDELKAEVERLKGSVSA